MNLLRLTFAILALSASVAMAAPGDQWILGIHHIDNSGAFTEYAGAGYSGVQSSGHADFVGDAYGRSGQDGVARVYWELSGSAINSGRSVPTSTELYTIEYWGTPAPGNDWQPVESQFKGAGGETFPQEPLIPWVGQFGTNHQWLGEDGSDDSDWHLIDNNGDGGPQAPFSADFNAPGDGIYMWLTSGSWVYAKWDFPFTFNRSWSAIRLTQFTGVTPPELNGDYNNNGVVDAADYAVWRDNEGSMSMLPNDPHDGIIGQDQHNTWRANFGMQGGAGAVVAIPEPTSISLVLGGLLGVMLAIGRRRVARQLTQ
ncbi:MAG: hypothetical protein WD851_10150 [Pirellulales bacterium]